MNTSKLTVGFIGVGLMGEGMASNLMQKGYPMVILGHRNRAPVERLCAQGASEAGDLAELARRCDVIHLCVTGSPQVESILLGEQGLLANAKPGTVIIDCSTSDPVSTLKLDEAVRKAGMHLVDAPLGGTPKEAAVGALSAMVGADADVFERIEPVIRSWAASVRHLGDVGLGHKMKLINNFVSMEIGRAHV